MKEEKIYGNEKFREISEILKEKFFSPNSSREFVYFLFKNKHLLQTSFFRNI